MRGCHVALTQRADASGGRRVAGGSWPGGQPPPPSSQPIAHTASIDRSEATMSKRARALILGATLAAMNLAGLTAVAHAQANHDPDGKVARRLATERQAGEPRRHGQVASPEQATADAALRRVLARERFSIPSGTPAQVPAPTQAPEPSGQPGWLVALLAVLAAALAVSGGLAVMAAKRASRRVRAGHA